MEADDLARLIDLTLLRPDRTEKGLEGLILKAVGYPFASVFVPPCHVALAAGLLKGSPIKAGTVVGFPLGYQTTGVKLHEAIEAVEAGAGEIDMLMNISRFKSGEDKTVEDEIASIVTALPGTAVKVIIETSYLTDEEKARACGLTVRGGADFVKTSTGFGPAGAKDRDVRLLVKAAAGRIKVKASGGIRTLEDTLKMIKAGAERIGTSSGIAIVEELLKE
jgi:deoxyribose-phosphate aldolase